MTFRYALKRMIRTPWASLATVGLAAALCVLLSLLTDMRARQERELETVYDLSLIHISEPTRPY